MRDQDHPHPPLLDDPSQQLHDPRLRRHVEGGRRLVGDEDVGVRADRHRDHHALSHPARELVRMVVDAALGLGQAHVASTAIARSRASRRPTRSCASIASTICSHRHQRVQRRHRILVDGRDLAAPDARHLALGRIGEVAATQEHVAARDAGAGRQQPHQRERRQRLAAPDSPTIPSRRPERTSNETPRTGLIGSRRGTAISTTRSRTSRTTPVAVSGSVAVTRGRVEDLLKVVAERVQRQHGDEDHEPGKIE